MMPSRRTLVVDYSLACVSSPRGMGNYTRTLYQHLLLQEEFNIVFLVPARTSAAHLNTVTSKFINLPTNSYVLNSLLFVPLYAAFCNASLLHYPANICSPLVGLFQYKTVATVHDAMFRNILLRGFSVSSIRTSLSRLYTLLVVLFSLPFLDRVITVSNYSSSKLTDLFSSCIANKLYVCGQGLPSDFPSYSSRCNIHSLSSESRLEVSYFLAISAAEPRKNLIGVLRTYTEYCKSHSNPLALVVVGSSNLLVSDSLALVGNIPSNANIIVSGYVTREALLSLYFHATAFLFFSLDEGFGIPLLEAFSCSVPVVALWNSSIPEVAGSAALYAHPHDHSYNSQLLLAVSSEPISSRLKVQGLCRLRSFDWIVLSKRFSNLISDLV